jgi:uncharacterized membrane protein HdeD (DUF308 family)
MTASQRERDLERLARRVTWTVGANALAALAFGLMLLSWPGPTLTVAATVLGLWLILDGATRVATAVRDWDHQDRVALGFRGVTGALLAVAGVLTVRHPYASVPVVIGVAAIGLLLGGAVELIMAIVERPPYWLARAGIGALALSAGLGLVLWPRPTVAILAALAGAALTAIGAVQLVLTRRAGRALRRLLP